MSNSDTLPPIASFSASPDVDLPELDNEHWGGKGNGLIRMASLDLPVPPGFVISTELCKLYQRLPEKVIEAVMADMGAHLDTIEAEFGYIPLLSVRSGAPVSMPGMMDTILNVGITPETMPEWTKRLGARTALDSLRRLLAMMGETAYHIPAKRFSAGLKSIKASYEVETDAELNEKALSELCDRYFEIYDKEGILFPDTLEEQLKACIRAVFDSWNNDRAKEYRKIEGIDDEMGTAVVVQAMVFGNLNEKSGSGVLFSRDPSTGAKTILAEYLPNAQGEDVVAGIRTPEKLDMSPDTPVDWKWVKQLYDLTQQLEDELEDMVDIEFTVQDSKLYILQVRKGKRSAQAAFQIAYDLLQEGKIDKSAARSRVTRKQLATLLRPSIDPKFDKEPAIVGLAGSQGIAIGKIVFTASRAVEMAALGEKVILVTEETTPDDVAGMNAAEGILTRTGGTTSHAAVVARGMDKPCVVGCTGMQLGTTVSPAYLMLKPDEPPLHDGNVISICGATGRVWQGEVPVQPGGLTDAASKLTAVLHPNKYTPISLYPKPNTVVCLQDALPLSSAEWQMWQEAFLSVAESGHPLYIETTLNANTEPALRSAMGMSTADRGAEKILKFVRENGGPQMKVLGPISTKGTKMAKLAEPQTVEELLGLSDPFVVTPQLKLALSADNHTEVLAKLREAELVLGDEFAPPLPVEYAAFSALE